MFLQTNYYTFLAASSSPELSHQLGYSRLSVKLSPPNISWNQLGVRM